MENLNKFQNNKTICIISHSEKHFQLSFVLSGLVSLLLFFLTCNAPNYRLYKDYFLPNKIKGNKLFRNCCINVMQLKYLIIKKKNKNSNNM